MPRHFKRLPAVMAAVGLLAVPAVALADTITGDANDIVANIQTTVQKAPGSTGAGLFGLTVTNGIPVGDPNGCNAGTGGSKPPVVLAISSDVSWVTVTQTTITLRDCDTGTLADGLQNAGTVNYSVASNAPAGATATITASYSSGGVTNGKYTSGSFQITTPRPSDTTPPVITPEVAGTLGDNGWYTSDVRVTWSVTDAQSTVSSKSGCDATTISTDTAAAGRTLTCSATSAGGTASESVTIKRDATAPTSVATALARAADSNGWYNAPVGWTTNGSDAASGIAGCSSGSYGGPDGTALTVSGKCTDNAGNASALVSSAQFKYDATAPTGVAIAFARAADHNGWYNAPVGWSANGTDATSGIDSCSSGTYSGPDGTGLDVGGRCTDNAGNESAPASSAAFKYDATAPTNVATGLARAADHNGWYNAPVGWTTSASDPTSGIASCSSGTYSGPDGTGLSVSGSCTDNAGNASGTAASAAFKYDATAPTDVATGLARAADHNGWYNAPVGWTTSATDPTSGIASCSSGTYSGPDGTVLTVAGTCTDNAGNASASAASSAFKFDDTNPTLSPSVTPNPVLLNGTANASAGASDATSLIASSGCDPVDTSAVGSRTVACRAADNAGNTNSANATYTVQYKFNGFFQPVDNKTLNGMKAGSTAPIKWQLLDANNVPVSSLAAVTKAASGVMACNATAPEDALEEFATGSTQLRYDATAKHFVYNWQSPKQPGKCYQVVFAFADGTSQSAQFTLK